VGLYIHNFGFAAQINQTLCKNLNSYCQWLIEKHDNNTIDLVRSAIHAPPPTCTHKWHYGGPHARTRSWKRLDSDHSRKIPYKGWRGNMFSLLKGSISCKWSLHTLCKATKCCSPTERGSISLKNPSKGEQITLVQKGVLLFPTKGITLKFWYKPA
jgi:hypothetical protein